MPRTAAVGSVFSVCPSSLRNAHQPAAATTTAASMTSGPPSCSDRSTAKRVTIQRYRFGRSLRTEELTVEPPGSLPTGLQESRRRMEVSSCSSEPAEPNTRCRTAANGSGCSPAPQGRRSQDPAPLRHAGMPGGWPSALRNTSQPSAASAVDASTTNIVPARSCSPRRRTSCPLGRALGRALTARP